MNKDKQIKELQTDCADLWLYLTIMCNIACSDSKQKTRRKKATKLLDDYLARLEA